MPKSQNTHKRIEFDPAQDFPRVNAALCCFMALLLPWVFIAVLRTWESRLLLLQCIFGVAVFISLTERVGERLGFWLSTGPLAVAPFNNPLSVTAEERSNKSMTKFKSQLWQLVVHVAFALLEIQTLVDLSRNGEENWWEQAAYMFQVQAQNGFLLELLYSLQLAVWFVTGFFQVFVFERVKDHLVMLAHHSCTILLLGLSYQHGYMRIGLMVLYIHDVTDISVDVLKLVNALKLEGTPGAFLVEISFVSMLGTWFYYRLYLLPKVVIYKAAYHGASCAIGLHAHGGDYAAFAGSQLPCWDKSPVASKAGEQVVAAALGRGESPPFESVWVVAVVATVLLGLLFLMHIYWYAIFVRILYKIITGVNPHEVGEEEYEGSDQLKKKA